MCNALGVLAASTFVLFCIAIAFWILRVVANWQIFAKAGEPGWKAVVPFYNTYTQYKLTWGTIPYWFVLFGGVVGSGLNALGGVAGVFGSAILLAVTILNIFALNKLAKAFGHGVGFTIGLFFLDPIFRMILAFGSDQYIRKD